MQHGDLDPNIGEFSAESFSKCFGGVMFVYLNLFFGPVFSLPVVCGLINMIG